MEHEKALEREVWGGKVGNLPSGLVPARQVLDGRTIILEPLDPAVHGAALYQATHGRYSKAALIKRYDGDLVLPDLLKAMSGDCERKSGPSMQGYGAIYPRLVPRRREGGS